MRKTLLMALLILACRPAARQQSSTGSVEDQPSVAERVVRQQYDAYNRHDLDAFVAAHAPDVRAYRYPDF